MELKRNTRPLGRPSTQPEAERQVIFGAPTAPEPLQEVEEAKLVIPPLQPVSKAPTASVQVESGIPRLQPVVRQRQVVELTPPGAISELSPQPTAAVEAVAEPVQETGGDRAVEWPFGEESVVEQRTPSFDPIPSLEVNEGRRGNFDARPALWATDDSGTSGDVGEDDSSTDAEPVIPPLEQTTVQPQAIPSLNVVRDGSAPPPNLTEIPQLDSFNTMEQAYLLLGRSSENEEIVILQSYGERFIRGKSKEDKAALLAGRVQLHEDKLVQDNYYDHADRQTFRRIRLINVTPQLAAKGVEFAFGLIDNGNPTQEEVRRHMSHYDVSEEVALKDLQNLAEDVYTWALIKIKIGRDFGSVSLTDLMPDF